MARSPPPFRLRKARRRPGWRCPCSLPRCSNITKTGTKASATRRQLAHCCTSCCTCCSCTPCGAAHATRCFGPSAAIWRSTNISRPKCCRPTPQQPKKSSRRSNISWNVLKAPSAIMMIYLICSTIRSVSLNAKAW
ncbi:hypothetical protein SDC9_200629 [bioreactor metagenome]|uniref:Uncharacterized protein n=1 Tax=bioreactor metagenome TaxID=1076179 RepID=A0A645IPH9_9ZZZZ